MARYRINQKFVSTTLEAAYKQRHFAANSDVKAMSLYCSVMLAVMVALLVAVVADGRGVPCSSTAQMASFGAASALICAMMAARQAFKKLHKYVQEVVFVLVSAALSVSAVMGQAACRRTGPDGHGEFYSLSAMLLAGLCHLFFGAQTWNSALPFWIGNIIMQAGAVAFLGWIDTENLWMLKIFVLGDAFVTVLSVFTNIQRRKDFSQALLLERERRQVQAEKAATDALITNMFPRDIAEKIIAARATNTLTGVIKMKASSFDCWGNAVVATQKICEACPPNAALMTQETMSNLSNPDKFLTETFQPIEVGSKHYDTHVLYCEVLPPPTTGRQAEPDSGLSTDIDYGIFDSMDNNTSVNTSVIAIVGGALSTAAGGGDGPVFAPPRQRPTPSSLHLNLSRRSSLMLLDGNNVYTPSVPDRLNTRVPTRPPSRFSSVRSRASVSMTAEGGLVNASFDATASVGEAGASGRSSAQDLLSEGATGAAAVASLSQSVVYGTNLPAPLPPPEGDPPSLTSPDGPLSPGSGTAVEVK
eukprot:m51a1_g6709 hypothetical protein (531) ;mRNA; f:119475-123218